MIRNMLSFVKFFGNLHMQLCDHMWACDPKLKLYSDVYMTFSKIGHILDQETKANELKRVR